MSAKTSRFESLLEAVPDALVGMDQEGVIRFVNRQTETLFGYDRDDLVGQPIELLLPEPLWQIYVEHQDDYFADPRTRSSGLDLELLGLSKDGAEFPVNISLSHIDTGDVLLVITAARDVAKQQHAVQDAELITSVVESSSDAIIGSTLEGAITSWNQAAERMYGYSSKEIIGKSGSLLAQAARVGEFFDNLDRVKDGKAVERLETYSVRKDGTTVPVSITVAPIRDEDGAIVGASAVHRDVTEQRRAFEVGQRMAAMVEFSAEAIVGTTLKGIVTSWNPAAERLFGYSGAEIVGVSISVLLPEDRTDEAKEILTRIRGGHSVVNFETTRLRKDGTAFPALLTVSPIHGADGTVVAVDSIIRDVTEQRKAFQAVQRIAAIVESSDDAILGRTLEGIVTSWNPAAERLFGYSSEEMIGTSVDVLIPRDQRAEIAAVVARIKAGQHVEHVETLRVRKDGTVFPVSLTFSPVRDERGAIVGASVIGRDMTEQEHAARYARSLIEAAMDPMATISPEGRITDVNEATVKITGVPRESLIGSDYAQYVTEPDKALALFQQVFEQGSVADVPLTVRHRDGTRTEIVSSASVYRDIGGQVLGVFASGHDVTRQRQALEVAERMAAIVEGSEDTIISGSLDGTIMSWNPAAVRMYGYASDEIVGQSIDVLIPPDRRGEIQQILASIETGHPVERVGTIRVRKDGTALSVSLTISPIRNADGVLVGTSAIHRDITGLEHAARYARSLIEAGLDPLVTISPEGKIDDLNEATVRLTGLPRESLVGTDFSLYFTDPDKAHLGYQRAFDEGSVTDFPLTVRHRDGTLTDVLYNASVYRDVGGEVLGVFAAARDMTRQKEAFEAAERIAAIVEFSGEAIFGCTTGGIITSWNPAAERLYGYRREEIVQRSGSILSPFDRDAGLLAILARVNAGEVVENFETLHLRRDGTAFPISLTVTPIRDADHTIVGVSAIARDLTAQRQAERYARLAAAIEFSGEAIVSETLEGIITSWNPAAERMFGYSAEEIVGRSGALVMPWDRTGEVSEISEIMARIRAGERVENYETIRARKDGTVFPVSLTITPIRDANGVIEGASSTPRDITRQKDAFEATQRMAAIVEYSTDAIIAQTLEGVVTSWNPAAEKLFGYTSREIIGQSIELLSPAGLTGEITSILASARAGQRVQHHETTRVRKDGVAVRVSLTVSPIRGANGVIVGASVIHGDLSQQG